MGLVYSTGWGAVGVLLAVGALAGCGSTSTRTTATLESDGGRSVRVIDDPAPADAGGAGAARDKRDAETSAGRDSTEIDGGKAPAETPNRPRAATLDAGGEHGSDAWGGLSDAASGTSHDSDGGQPSNGSELDCVAGVVRCNPKTNVRERCEDHTWVEEDFVCATSIRVATGDGMPCATKADGTFTCWWGRRELKVQESIIATKPPGTVRSAESAGGRAVFLLDDGTLVLDGNSVEDVVQFEAASNDTCWVTRNGEARCSAAGKLTEQTAAQVAHAGGRRCVLLQDGSAFCLGSSSDSIYLKGQYTAISTSPYQTCGLDMDGVPWCSDLGSDTALRSSPLMGRYTKLAVNDLGLCALSGDGQLQCVTFSDGLTYTPLGTFTEVDAGDWSVCGIRTDGSISCWQIQDPLGEQEKWYTPDGW